MTLPVRTGTRIDPAALQQYQSKLGPGCVLRLYSPVAEKVKRHLLIFSNAERSLAFLINSRPSPFIVSKPDLLKRQVPMPRATHLFMDHDSVIACHDTVLLPTFPVLAQGMAAGKIDYLGAVDADLRPLIIVAAIGSKLIAQRDQIAITTNFS